MISILLIITSTFITGSIIFWTLRLGIGPTPTSHKIRSVIRKNLPDNVKGEIMELGCGWGHLIPILKENYPKSVIQPWERSPIPALFSRIYHGCDIKFGDFFNASYSNTGLIFCYLYPKAMERIEKEIIPQLPEGCWILSHTFSLSNLIPAKTIKANDLYQTTVYLYQITHKKP